MRDLRCFDGRLVLKQRDDQQREPDCAMGTSTREETLFFSLVGSNRGTVPAATREAMGSLKRPRMSRATYIQFFEFRESG